MPSHFDLLAPIYDRVMGAPRLGPLEDLMHLPTAGRILEAGGGTGRRAFLLRGRARMIVVTDVSFAMLHRAPRRMGLELVQCRAERLPFPVDCFGVVFMADALHHFRNQLDALEEALRILCPGGRLLIEEPDIGKAQGKAIVLFESLLRMHSRFLSAEEVTDWVKGRGLPFFVTRDERAAVRIAVDKEGD